MSGLRDRLHRLKSSMNLEAEPNIIPAGDTRIEAEKVAEYQNKIKNIDDNINLEDTLHDWMGAEGRIVHNEYGQFLIREIRYPLYFQHGIYRLEALLHGSSAIKRLSKEDTAIGHEQLLFFDTETTGLGIGAGNVAFMIGIGYYASEEFVVEQMFIRNPAEELAMLVYLEDKLTSFSHLVTYNGRTFDWPIVKNRYVMNRLSFGADELVQLDLLYPSRSIWRNTLVSCRLGTVEEERLGIRRGFDVAGSLAPTFYFQYLAEGNASIMEGVFRHNERDIVTLACLLAHFCYLLEGRIEWQDLEAEELFRTAVWLDKLGETDLAESALDYLLNKETEDCISYFIPIAEIRKRKGLIDEAVMLWKTYIQLSDKSKLLSIDPFVELAMYYEHQVKNFEAALFYTEEALQQAVKRLSLARRDAKQRELIQDLHKRKERIQRKSSARQLRLMRTN